MDLQDRVPAEELKRRATSVLVLAFAGDPMTRWVWRDPATYLGVFPEFASAFGGRAFDHGSAFIAEDSAGAALWLPPGVEPDEAALGALIERTAASKLAQDIAAVLTPVLGARGVAALYQRALHVTRGSHAWLAEPLEIAQPSIDLVALKAAFARQDRAEATAAATAVLLTFHDLLASLIGSALSERLLEPVWAQSLRRPTPQDTPP